MFNKRQKIIFFIVAGLFLVFQPFGLKTDLLRYEGQTKNPYRVSVNLSANSALAYEAGESTLITKVLSGESPENGKWVRQFYSTFLSIFNILMVAVLVFIAIANILRIEIGTYEIKKLLPYFLVAAILANLALPILTILSRVVDTLSDVWLFKPKGAMMDYMTQGGYKEKMSIRALVTTIGAIIVGNFTGLGLIIGLIITLSATIIGILFILILNFRPFIIYILAAISPLAIACLVLPPTQKYFKKWLSTILIWLFLPVISYAIINIGYKVPTSMSIAGDGLIKSIIGVYLPLIIRSGLLLLAIRVPFSLEKDISGLIHQLGRWTGQRAAALPGYIGGLQKNKKLEMLAQRNIDGNSGRMDRALTWGAKGLMKISKKSTEGLTAGDIPRAMGWIARGGGLAGENRVSRLSQRLGTTWDSVVRLGGLLPEEFGVLPLAQLSNFSVYRKLAMDKQKTREHEAGLDTRGVNVFAREQHVRFHADDNRTMFDDQSYDQISKFMGIMFDQEGRVLLDPNGPFVKYRTKFEEAMQKGNLGDIGDEKSLLGRAAKEVGVTNIGNEEDLNMVFASFLGQNFAQTDSQSTWWRSMLRMEIESSDDNDFAEFILALRAKQRSSKTYFTPPGYVYVCFESEDQKNRRVRTTTGRNAGDPGNGGTAPSGSPISTDDEDGEDQSYENQEADSDIRALRSGMVDLSPGSIQALADELVVQGAISSNSDQLARVFAKELGGMRKSMNEIGLDDDSINSIFLAMKRGSIKTSQDLVQYLPQGIANKNQAVFERLAALQSSRALAFSAAGSTQVSQDTRLYAQRMAQNYSGITQSTRNGLDIYEAADKISLHESGLGSISEAELNSAKTVIARTLNVPTEAVNQKVAQSAARAFEALGSISGDKARITIQSPELVQATASQQIRDDLVISATKRISDAVKNSVATQKPISDKSFGEIRAEIQTALDLQLQISRPDLSGITDQIKQKIASEVTTQLLSRDIKEASEQSIFGDVQKSIAEAKDKISRP